MSQRNSMSGTWYCVSINSPSLVGLHFVDIPISNNNSAGAAMAPYSLQITLAVSSVSINSTDVVEQVHQLLSPGRTLATRIEAMSAVFSVTRCLKQDREQVQMYILSPRVFCDMILGGPAIIEPGQRDSSYGYIRIQ